MAITMVVVGMEVVAISMVTVATVVVVGNGFGSWGLILPALTNLIIACCWLCVYCPDYIQFLFHRTCFFTTEATNQKTKFVAQLNKSFGGGGGFTVGFTDGELMRFLQFCKRIHSVAIAKGTILIQPSSSIWVLNDKTQLEASGCPIAFQVVEQSRASSESNEEQSHICGPQQSF